MVGDEKNGETEYTSDRKQGRCYDVYHRNSDATWETIKNGFSWPAMLFGAFWAWSKGLVGIGFALLALGIFLRFTPVLFAMILGEAGVIFDLLISLDEIKNPHPTGVVMFVGYAVPEWVMPAWLCFYMKCLNSNGLFQKLCSRKKQTYYNNSCRFTAMLGIIGPLRGLFQSRILWVRMFTGYYMGWIEWKRMEKTIDGQAEL